MENIHIVVLNQSIKLQTHGEYYHPAKTTDTIIQGCQVKQILRYALALTVASRTKSKEGSETMRNIIYIPDSTWTDLDQEPIFQKFMKEYIDLLQNSLTKIKVKGDSYSTSHYTCGQAHDPRNPSWQPFKLLSRICRKYNYDPLITRDIIEEKIYRRLECECQIIDNRSGRRRKKLINNS